MRRYTHNLVQTNKYILILILFIFIAACSEDEPEIDCAQSDLELTQNNISDSQCGLNDGKIEVVASGGQAPYTFSLNGGAASTVGNFEDLEPGEYSVTLKDGNNCERTATFEIGEVNSIELSASTTEAGCETTEGTIEVSATGGSGFQFKLDDGEFQASNVFTALGHGEYELTAKDENGCETTESVRVLSGISYSTQVEEVILTNCAVEGCHVAGTGNPDWTVFSNVKENAGSIKTRTQNGTMPPDGLTISDEEIALIACWVDDGALDN